MSYGACIVGGWRVIRLSIGICVEGVLRKVFYDILGCILEAVAMMVTTIGIVVPIVIAARYDPLFFGMFLTILMELSLITPPVGLNLDVIQNLRPKDSNINDVFIGIAPFVVAFLAFVAVIT